MEESLRLHADAQAAVQVSCYVVVPLVPRQSVARAALAWAKRSRLPTASLERPVSAHRRAVREQLAHVDALRAELEAEGMATELLDGEQVRGCCGRGSTRPGPTTRAGAPRRAMWRCWGSSTRPATGTSPARRHSDCASRSRLEP